MLHGAQSKCVRVVETGTKTMLSPHLAYELHKCSESYSVSFFTINVEHTLPCGHAPCESVEGIVSKTHTTSPRYPVNPKMDHSACRAGLLYQPRLTNQQIQHICRLVSSTRIAPPFTVASLQ
ncbi:hypothetical protein EVAR_904_1 [Eumeta japonica]|uniref:Uncharacterized protein n=1 Tax=Eumeta variegata TaxID=151549 RepID=A0A4C1SDQ9_EUMVA|nr:hypothetical protein EVAR_904_1 [Eumeta japonica]